MRLRRDSSIAIIGGGFSGTILAARLLREATGPLKLYLIERRRQVGQGVAYSTSSPRHLLNVPAGRMSAFPERPGHLLEWLQGVCPASGYTEHSFVPRQLYGAYLGDCLRAAQQRKGTDVDFEIVHDEALGVRAGEQSATVQLENCAISAGHVVLAVGNFPPGHLSAPGLADLARGVYVADPWSDLRLSGGDRVLLLGSGLTAIDLALSICEQQPKAVVHMASPAGELPAEWRASTGTWPVDLEGVPARVRDLTKAIRRQIEVAEGAGHQWEEVFDSLRGQTPALWRRLPIEERQIFMRRVRSYFERYRHRVSPPTATALRQLLAEGRLRLFKGLLESVAAGPEGLAEVRLRPGGSLLVSKIVNCTGPACDYRRMQHPLIRSLMDSGMIRADPLPLGLACNDDGGLLGPAEEWLWSLGPPLKGARWETTAVPEIRVQAKELAAILTREID